MEQLILIFHVVAAIAIVALILLQQGKGADMGASFGSGASQTLFGSTGSGNALTRATAVLAALFFLTSLSLAYVAKQKASGEGNIFDEDIPTLEESRKEAPPRDEEIPQMSRDKAPAGEDIPQ